MKIPYFFIAFCFFFIPLLFIFYYRWHHARKNKRAPFTDKFLRSPGQSLNEQIQSVSEDINIYSGTVMSLPFLILSIALILNLKLILFISFITLFEIYYFFRLWRAFNKRRLLRLGYDGEVAVGQELNLLMLDGCHVFHDLVTEKIKKFNIDHIIVGGSGVYAVETKTRSKSRIKKENESANVIYDGKSLIFPHYSDTDSLKQARLNAIHLQKWLTGAVGEQVEVEAILTIPGWFVERRSAPRGVHVLSPKEIKTFLKSKKETPLSDTLVRRIVHQLDQKCRDVDPITVQIDSEAKKRTEAF